MADMFNNPRAQISILLFSQKNGMIRLACLEPEQNNLKRSNKQPLIPKHQSHHLSKDELVKTHKATETALLVTAV